MTSPGFIPGHGAYPLQGSAPAYPARAGVPAYPVPAAPPASPVPGASATAPPCAAAPGTGALAGSPYPVYHLPAPAPRPRLAAVVGRVVRETGLLLLCLFASLVSLGSIMSHEEVLTGRPMRALPGLGLVGLALVLLVALFARHRWPVAVTVVSSVAGLLTGLDTTVGLVAMTTVVRRAGSVRDPAPWVVGLVLGAGTWRAIGRDAVQAVTGNSVVGIFAFDQSNGVGTLHGSTAPALTLLVMALPVVTGLLLRARDGERSARQRAQAAAAASAQVARTAQEQARVSTHLAERVDLQEERERVAREVHDGLGHRLSLLALHAAVLEAAAQPGEPQEEADGQAGAEGGPGGAGGSQEADILARAVGPDQDVPTDHAREAARLVREEAETAMRDLRSLLTVLREPVGAAEPAPRLADLAGMVDDVLAARQPVTSSIFLDRADQADDVLSRAVYRIVQECLTNARRHAPGRTVRLRVEGGPTTGIDITCSNPVDVGAQAVGEAAGEVAGEAEAVGGARGTDAGAGSGTGLRGMAKRAEICGGTFQAGLDGQGSFVVRSHLPWWPAPT
ncbi:sensor histidine kinase [Actinomyces wuliandei]|uniref:sensor histidine kinase n=1 Tax=Actinomyces wuliandei TaxID=2057743 RepID=UPI00214C513F|nr:histidine kinase [Actinomyces wuliandei]